jgi:hypothetical protein
MLTKGHVEALLLNLGFKLAKQQKVAHPKVCLFEA